MRTNRPTGVDATRYAMVRALLPPLAIVLAVATAATLLLTAAAIAPLPVPAALPATASAAAPAPAAPGAAGATPGGSPVSDLLRSVPLVLPPLPRSLIDVDLARLVYAPGIADPNHRLPGPVLLVVESGALTVHIEGSGDLAQPQQPPQAVRGTVRLQPGDGLTLPAATTVAVHNEGSVPTVVLAVRLFRAGPAVIPLGPSRPARWGVEWAPGATVQALGGAGLVDASVQAATITLQRVSLAPDATMPLTATGAMVLAVETGALELEAVDGFVWQQTPDGTNTWLEPPQRTTLLPEDAGLLQAGANATVRNAGSGPLLALVVCVVPTAPAPRGVGDDDARASLNVMTEMQYGRGQPLPAEVGRLQSLVTIATPTGTAAP